MPLFLYPLKVVKNKLSNNCHFVTMYSIYYNILCQKPVQRHTVAFSYHAIIKRRYCNCLDYTPMQVLCGPSAASCYETYKLPFIIDAMERDDMSRIKQIDKQTGGSTPASCTQWPSQASTQGTVIHGRTVD